MNTRVFKDVGKYQHKAWLGFTTRQVVFVFPALLVTFAVLIANAFLWKFGDWFIYTVILGFTSPMMLMGVHKPNNLFFETYLKYRLNWEMRVPVRYFISGGTYDKTIFKAKKSFKETAY